MYTWPTVDSFFPETVQEVTFVCFQIIVGSCKLSFTTESASHQSHQVGPSPLEGEAPNDR